MRQIENTIPVLPAADLRASIYFYELVLGYTEGWAGGDTGSVSRDAYAIMPQQNSGLGPSKVLIGCEDVLALHEQFTASGAQVVQ